MKANRRAAIACTVVLLAAGVSVAVQFALGSDAGLLVAVPIFVLASALAISFAFTPPAPTLAAILAALVTGLAMLPNTFVLKAVYDHDQDLFRYFLNMYWGLFLPAATVISGVVALVFSLARRSRHNTPDQAPGSIN